MTTLKNMESSRDITAVSSNNGGDDNITDDTNLDADSPSIRNRIACKTGHILNNLTLSVWYSYALLYFQNVAGLSSLGVGILFFVSHILMAVTSVVIRLGRDERIWKSFSVYGIQKARHVVGSAGILFAWPFAFIPCLFGEAGTSNIALAIYYLMPVVLLSICWPLAELSYASLMKKIQAEADTDPETSRSILRVCKVCLYIVLWALLQQSSEARVNSNISEQFMHLALILVPVGFLFVFAFHLTVLEPRPRKHRPEEVKPDEEKNCGRSTADISSPSTIVNQELTRMGNNPKLTWYEWLKEPLLYKVGFLVLFTNTTFRVVQCYLPLYLTETLQLRKESVASFPLIITITRIVTEIICKSFVVKLRLRVVILCTTSAIFGTCMWFFMQSAEQTSLVYAPTVIFAFMSSLITMVTPTLHQEVTGNQKEASSFVSGVLECTERVLLGGIVLAIQTLYPDNKDRSAGDFLRVAFPAAFGTCIVVPMLIATAFMNSRNSNEGPELTITAASPREENGPLHISLPVMTCVDRLALSHSETPTPPLHIDQHESRRIDSDCAELQGSTSTAVPSDAEPDETRAGNQRDKDIEEVKRALDELHRLPATDL